MNIESATWNTEVMAVQNGTELDIGATEVTCYDIMALSGGKCNTKYKALGVTDGEIGFVYELLSDGTYGKTFTQTSGTAATGEFSYDADTKEISFFATDVSAMTDARFACTYERKTDGNSQVIHVSGAGLPSTVLVTAYGVAKDICSEQYFPCQIKGMAVIDQNYSYDLAADGDPSVQGLNMEFIRNCGVADLYTFTIYTEDAPTE